MPLLFWCTLTSLKQSTWHTSALKSMELETDFFVFALVFFCFYKLRSHETLRMYSCICPLHYCTSSIRQIISLCISESVSQWTNQTVYRMQFCVDPREISCQARITRNVITCCFWQKSEIVISRKLGVTLDYFVLDPSHKVLHKILD